MALPRITGIQRLGISLCRQSFCKLTNLETACYIDIGYLPQYANRSYTRHGYTLRLCQCCGLKHSARHLATSPDISDKPWYTRWAIKSNDRFAASLGKISPKAQKQYLQFVEGTKLFYHDAKHTYQLNSRMKRDKLQLSDLNWRDIYVKQQISKDFAKVVPTLFLLCLPFVYYVLLPIIFLYPRPFLCDQFFTRDQLLKYNTQFHQTRLALYPSVINQLVKKIKHLPNNQDSKSFMGAIERLESGLPLTSSHLLDARELFKVVLALRSLPRVHMVTINKLYSRKSFLLPSFMLRRRLHKTLVTISAMDTALLRENLHSLPHQDLEKLCFQRGLDSNNVDSTVLATWLTDWVQLSTNLTEKEESLLAHAAVLLVKSQSLKPA